MGKLIVTEFVTLDGVVEDPGGSEGAPNGGWAFKFDRGDAGNAFKLDELAGSDAQLLGRVTYEGFAAAWPSRSGDEFSDRMNGMPKYVVSSTLTDPTWSNTTVIGADLPAEIAALKARHARDILVAGSVTLVHGLLAAGLVDELRLMVYPFVAGGGKKLFADGMDATSFELVEATQSAQVALLVLRRA